MEENIRAEQKEALLTLTEFNERLVKNMKIITKEFEGNRLDDTDKFLQGIVDAVNWEIQVVNGTISLLNENQERLNKEAFNAGISNLSAAIKSGKDEEMSKAFQNVIPVFEQLGEIAAEVSAT